MTGVLVKRGNLDTGTDMHREKMRHIGKCPVKMRSDTPTNQRLSACQGQIPPHRPQKEAKMPTH